MKLVTRQGTARGPLGSEQFEVEVRAKVLGSGTELCAPRMLRLKMDTMQDEILELHLPDAEHLQKLLREMKRGERATLMYKIGDEKRVWEAEIMS